MKTKLFLFALAATLFVLSGCKKESNTEPKTDSTAVTEVNDFTKNLNTLEGYLGKPAADVVADLQKAGLKSAEAGESGISAADTVGNVYISFSATSGTSGNVNFINCVYYTTETKSYVDNAEKLAETIQKIGQSHNLPSGNALTFNDYAYDIEGQERISGYDWDQMVSGLANLGTTYNAVFNWKNSGGTYGLLSIIRKVTEGTTAVTYKLQDYSYNN